MKKKLLLSMALLATHFTYAQFTPDNLVVLRTENVTDYTALSKLNFIELTTKGTQVGNITPIGNNNFYISHSASSLNDGTLSLSTDGKLLTVYGYGELPSNTGNSNIQTTTNSRTLAIIKLNKSQQLINTDGIFGATAVRTAIAFPKSGNLYGVYLGGGSVTGQTNTQLQYGILDTVNNTINSFVRIAGYNTKGIRIFNGQLYASSSASTQKITKFSSELPETSSSPVSLTNNPASPGDFVLFGNNILYVADDGYTGSVGGLHKYYSTDEGTTWTYIGKINSGLTSDDANFRFMTGRYEEGKITLYAVTNKSTGNSIIKIVDNSANDKFDIISMTTISTATATTGYRGISFTPNSTITLPVSLNSFTAKAINGNIVLNWSTASEQNNKYFEVLRSTDGISFSRIGEIAGKNNSNTYNQYNFTDYTPASGTNYYQLKQVDLNGNSEVFGPVSAHINLENAGNFRVVTSAEGIKAILKSDKTTESKVIVTDISGRTYFSKDIQLKKGDNTIDINTQIPNGIYIIKIESPGFSDTLKFKK